MATWRDGATSPPQSITHQTVQLSRGRHRSPREGACVVELASMLAGERFSDHPRSVCPVIASYMRTLNDLLSDSERQLLYRYAAEIVDTRGNRQVRRARVEACAAWAREMGVVSHLRAELARLVGNPRWISALCARSALELSPNPTLALALVDELVAVGRNGSAPEQTAAPPALAPAAPFGEGTQG